MNTYVDIGGDINTEDADNYVNIFYPLKNRKNITDIEDKRKNNERNINSIEPNINLIEPNININEIRIYEKDVIHTYENFCTKITKLINEIISNVDTDNANVNVDGDIVNVNKVDAVSKVDDISKVDAIGKDTVNKIDTDDNSTSKCIVS